MSEADRDKRPLILVLGPGKSGTTALFFCLKACAERHYGIEFPNRFEPNTAEDVDAFKDKFGIVKMLLERYQRTTNDFLPRFDRRVFISRDPRDNVISRLVYYAGTRLKAADAQTREAVMQKFLAKQQNPESVSVLELFEAIGPLMGNPDGARSAWKTACTPLIFFASGDGGFFRLRYEDFLDGKLSDLEGYLGFDVSLDFEVPANLQRVKRTRAHGYWRNWFTDDDFTYFVTARQDDLLRMGYDDLAPYRGRKVIAPVEISEYLQRQLRA